MLNARLMFCPRFVSDVYFESRGVFERTGEPFEAARTLSSSPFYSENTGTGIFVADIRKQ
jgi:hypothetical protein